MNKYMVSGFIEEVGACQSYVWANNKQEAIHIATERDGFYMIVNVSLEKKGNSGNK